VEGLERCNTPEIGLECLKSGLQMYQTPERDHPQRTRVRACEEVDSILVCKSPWGTPFATRLANHVAIAITIDLFPVAQAANTTTQLGWSPWVLAVVVVATAVPTGSWTAWSQTQKVRPPPPAPRPFHAFQPAFCCFFVEGAHRSGVP
jgi:hypothetical protein